MIKLRPKIEKQQFLIDADTYAARYYAESYMREDKINAFLHGINFAVDKLQLKDVKK